MEAQVLSHLLARGHAGTGSCDLHQNGRRGACSLVLRAERFVEVEIQLECLMMVISESASMCSCSTRVAIDIVIP